MKYAAALTALAVALPSTFLITAAASPLDPLNMATSFLRRGIDPAQAASTVDLIWPFLSTGCQKVITETISPDCPVYQCLHVGDYLNDLNTIIDLLGLTCSAQPCSSDILDGTIQRVAQGCSAELGLFGYSADNFTEIPLAYETTRNAACLRTSNPYQPGDTTPPSTSYCAISLFQQYNETITSDALTQFASAAESAASGGEAAVQERIKTSLQDVVCIDCVFGILDVVELAYPGLQTIALSQNSTVNGWLEGTCSSEGLTILTDGTLPEGISQTATVATHQNNNNGTENADVTNSQRRRHHKRFEKH
ncbi:hypothetical protein I317_06754 [Kwoniella heveanensis CBS 569]|nr:hypothetical protein I317_06754 [Kwoniella heveanensis CBS 569]